MMTGMDDAGKWKGRRWKQKECRRNSAFRTFNLSRCLMLQRLEHTAASGQSSCS